MKRFRNISIIILILAVIFSVSMIITAENKNDSVCVRGVVPGGKEGVNVSVVVYNPGKSFEDVVSGAAIEDITTWIGDTRSKKDGIYTFEFKPKCGFGEYTVYVRSEDSDEVEIKKIQYKSSIKAEIYSESVGNIFTDENPPKLFIRLHNDGVDTGRVTLNYYILKNRQIVSEGMRNVSIAAKSELTETVLPEVDNYGLYEVRVEIPETGEELHTRFSKILNGKNAKKASGVGLNTIKRVFSNEKGLISVYDNTGAAAIMETDRSLMPEKGEASGKINIEIASGQTGRIYFDEKNVELDVTLKNGKGSFTGSVCWEVINENVRVCGGKQAVNIADSESMRLPLKISTNRFGFFTLIISVYDSMENLAARSKAFKFSVANAPEEGKKDPNLGITIHAVEDHVRNHGDPSINTELAYRAGFGFIRNEVWWRYYEKEAGVYRFPDVYSKAVKKAKELDMEVVPILSYSNPVVTSENPPASDAALERFSRFAVEYKKDLGTSTNEMSVWNEYNHPGFNKDNQPPESYVKMLKSVYASLKNEDENTFVWGLVTAGVDKSFIRKVFAGGGGNYMDGIDVHHYALKSTPENGGIITDITSLKALMKLYGLQDKPIYISENGWSSVGTDGYADERQQACYNVRVRFLNSAYALADKYAYYTMNDGGLVNTQEQRFGLVRSPQSEIPYEAKPAYLAICNYNKLMMNSVFSGMLKLDSDVTAYRYILEDGRDCFAVWSIQGDNEKTFNLGTGSAELYDMYGNAEKIYGIDGNFTLRLSEEPVYIIGKFNCFTEGTKQYDSLSAELERSGMSLSEAEISSISGSDASDMIKSLAKNASDSVVTWITLEDSGVSHLNEDNMGIIKSEFSEIPYEAKEAYAALACFSTLLGGAEFKKVVQGDNYYQYQFRSGYEDIFMQWGSGGSSSVSLRTAKRIIVYDLFGNASEVYSEDGIFNIPAENTPVYFKPVEGSISVKSNGSPITGAYDINSGDEISIAVNPMEVSYENIMIAAAGYDKDNGLKMLSAGFVSKKVLAENGAAFSFTAGCRPDIFKVMIWDSETNKPIDYYDWKGENE